VSGQNNHEKGCNLKIGSVYLAQGTVCCDWPETRGKEWKGM